MAPWMSVVAVLGVSAVGVGASTVQSGNLVAQAEQMIQSFKKLGGAATPGLRKQVENLHSSLEGVLPLIFQGHQSTQSALDDTILTLQMATTSAQNEQMKATAMDTEWYNCVVGEVSILDEKEKAENEASVLEIARDAACERANATKTSRRSLPAELALFNCAMMSDANACISAYHQRETTFRAELSDLRSLVQEDVELWNAHNTECGRISAQHVNQMALIATLTQNFKDQEVMCQQKLEVRNEGICTFGGAYASTCTSKTAYNDLVAATGVAAGNEFSAPDRETEYTTVKTATCHLDNFLGGEESACTGFEFPEHLDLHAVDVPEVYTCGESSFTFDGRTWERPEGGNPRSTDFNSVETSFSFKNGAFTLCL